MNSRGLRNETPGQSAGIDGDYRSTLEGLPNARKAPPPALGNPSGVDLQRRGFRFHTGGRATPGYSWATPPGLLPCRTCRWRWYDPLCDLSDRFSLF